MSTVGLFIDAIETTRQLMANNQEETEKKRVLKTIAVYSLLRAINLTQTYLAYKEENDYETNIDMQRRVTQSWEDASKDMMFIGEEAKIVARRCFLKSNYWANPSNWTTEDIDSADISLEKLEAQLHTTLKEMTS